MSESPTPSPKPKATPVLAAIVTFALLSGWLAMYFLGVFDKTGKVFMLAVLATDLTVIAAFWAFAMRNDLNRKE
jgi:hypothetical protein